MADETKALVIRTEKNIDHLDRIIGNMSKIIGGSALQAIQLSASDVRNKLVKNDSSLGKILNTVEGNTRNLGKSIKALSKLTGKNSPLEKLNSVSSENLASLATFLDATKDLNYGTRHRVIRSIKLMARVIGDGEDDFVKSKLANKVINRLADGAVSAAGAHNKTLGAALQGLRPKSPLARLNAAAGMNLNNLVGLINATKDLGYFGRRRITRSITLLSKTIADPRDPDPTDYGSLNIGGASLKVGALKNLMMARKPVSPLAKLNWSAGKNVGNIVSLVDAMKGLGYFGRRKVVYSMKKLSEELTSPSDPSPSTVAFLSAEAAEGGVRGLAATVALSRMKPVSPLAKLSVYAQANIGGLTNSISSLYSIKTLMKMKIFGSLMAKQLDRLSNLQGVGDSIETLTSPVKLLKLHLGMKFLDKHLVKMEGMAAVGNTINVLTSPLKILSIKASLRMLRSNMDQIVRLGNLGAINNFIDSVASPISRFFVKRNLNKLVDLLDKLTVAYKNSAEARGFIDELDPTRQLDIKGAVSHAGSKIRDKAKSFAGKVAKRVAVKGKNIMMSRGKARLSKMGAGIREGFGRAKSYALSKMPVKKFAEGGIVTQPTRGLVGEAGPEGIIPLTKMGFASLADKIGGKQNNMTVKLDFIEDNVNELHRNINFIKDNMRNMSKPIGKVTSASASSKNNPMGMLASFIISSLASFIGGEMIKVKEAIKGLGTNIAKSAKGGVISRIGDAAKSAFGSLKQSRAGQFISGVSKSVMSKMGSYAQKAKSFGQGAWSTAKAGGQKAWQGAKAVGRGAKKLASKAAGPLVKKAMKGMKAITKSPLARVAGKLLGKVGMPVLGAVMSGMEVKDRYSAGDTLGAGIEAANGIMATAAPFAGPYGPVLTGASLLGTAINVYRDLNGLSGKYEGNIFSNTLRGTTVGDWIQQLGGTYTGDSSPGSTGGEQASVPNTSTKSTATTASVDSLKSNVQIRGDISDSALASTLTASNTIINQQPIVVPVNQGGRQTPASTGPPNLSTPSFLSTEDRNKSTMAFTQSLMLGA